MKPGPADAPCPPVCLQVLTDMSKSIGGKPWYKINTGYYQNINGQRVAVKPGATYKGYAAVPNNGLCWQACPILMVVEPGYILWSGVCMLGVHA